MNTRFLLVLLIILFPNSSYSQEIIKGFISDSLIQPIVSANVILKDSTDSRIVSFSFTNNKGRYVIKNISYEGICYLVVSSIGYKSDTTRILLSKDLPELKKNIILEEKMFFFTELKIEAQKPPIQVNNDTVTYNVATFTDGSEEVIEDILRKLPGLDVSENGKIIYKGSPINKVLIEGDDMLGKNYSIATKNIASNIVEKIQAIDNYQENENLKGIEDSDQKALNIILKDGIKSRFFINSNIGYGYKNRYKASTYILGIEKNFKHYFLGSANNIGSNPTFYDYFSLGSNLSKDRISTSKIININYLTPNISPKRANLNRIIFGSSNFTYNFSNKIKIKNNINFTKDRKSLNRELASMYITDLGNINLVENQELLREPLIVDGNIEVNYHINSNSQINYNLKALIGEIKDKSVLITPNRTFSEYLDTEDSFIEQNLKYTNRISDKTAILFETQYLYNNSPQNYMLDDPGNMVPSINQSSNFTYNSVVQNSRIRLDDFSFQAQLLKKGLTSDFSSNIGYSDTQEELDSRLVYTNLSILLSDSTANINQTNNHQKHFFAEIKNKKKYLNWNIISDLSINIKSSQFLTETKTDFFFSPKLGFEFKVGSKAKLTSIYKRNKNFTGINNLYSNYILKNYRTFSNGLQELEIIDTHTILANFLYSDWFNQLTFFINLVYLNNNKSYASQIFIDNLITLEKKILASGNKNYIGTLQLSKFISPISSTVKITSNLSKYVYYNSINTPSIRSNISIYSNHNLFFKTAFKKWYNLENNFKYLTSTAISNSNTNTNISFELFTNLILKPSKKWIIKIINERFFYNLNKKNDSIINFLDVHLKFVPKRNKFSLQLRGRNLLNQSFFEQTLIEDYFASFQKFDLLPRHILLEIDYRF